MHALLIKPIAKINLDKNIQGYKVYNDYIKGIRFQFNELLNKKFRVLMKKYHVLRIA